MAGARAEGFSYGDRVAYLKQFILSKSGQIGRACSDKVNGGRKISDINKANFFVYQINEIIHSKYLADEKLSLTIAELMVQLKEDYKTLKAREEELQKAAKAKDEEIFTFTESVEHDAFVIPDEVDIYSSAKLQKMKRELSQFQEELSHCRKELRVCHDLQGIICRKNDFFASVWR